MSEEHEADKLIQITETPTIIEDQPTKPKKVKKEISPERKAQLIEQLKRARLKASENRKARKEAKEKEKADIKASTPASTPASKPNKNVSIVDPRDAELERLRNQVKTFTLQDIATKSKKKAKPKPKVKTASTNDTDDDESSKVEEKKNIQTPPQSQQSQKEHTPLQRKNIQPPSPKSPAPTLPPPPKKKKPKKVYGIYLNKRRR
jgi:hypothetical protein